MKFNVSIKTVSSILKMGKKCYDGNKKGYISRSIALRL